MENRVHVNDLHATLLHLVGIDHGKLTYRHNGRAFRLTDGGGSVIREILVLSGGRPYRISLSTFTLKSGRTVAVTR